MTLIPGNSCGGRVVNLGGELHLPGAGSGKVVQPEEASSKETRRLVLPPGARPKKTLSVRYRSCQIRKGTWCVERAGTHGPTVIVPRVNKAVAFLITDALNSECMIWKAQTKAWMEKVTAEARDLVEDRSP